MKDVDLATPGMIGALKTPNRIIMSPMTRSRAAPNGVPSEMAIEYYAQRASAGLDHHRGHGAVGQRHRVHPHAGDRNAGAGRGLEKDHRRGERAKTAACSCS